MKRGTSKGHTDVFQINTLSPRSVTSTHTRDQQDLRNSLPGGGETGGRPGACVGGGGRVLAGLTSTRFASGRVFLRPEKHRIPMSIRNSSSSTSVTRDMPMKRPRLPPMLQIRVSHCKGGERKGEEYVREESTYEHLNISLVHFA